MEDAGSVIDVLHDDYEGHETRSAIKQKGEGMGMQLLRTSYIYPREQYYQFRHPTHASTSLIRLQSPRPAAQLLALHPKTHPPDKFLSTAPSPTKTPTPPCSASSTTVARSHPSPATYPSPSANPPRPLPAAKRLPQETTPRDAPHTTQV